MAATPRNPNYSLDNNGAYGPNNDANIAVLAQIAAQFACHQTPPIVPTPVLSYTPGGSLAQTTYYVKNTYTTPGGFESAPSAEASIVVPANNVLIVQPPGNTTGTGTVPEASGWNAYVSTASGTETKQNLSLTAIGSPWQEPATGLIAGSALPAGISPMSVLVEPGQLLVNNAIVSQPQQNTATITAPVSNPRIDYVVGDAITGAVSVVTGTEGASPVAPNIPLGKMPVATILLQTSTTTIGNSMITDKRLLYIGSGLEAMPIGSSIDWPGIALPDADWDWEDGGTLSRTTNSALFSVIMKQATITVTIANPAVVTWTAHGLRTNHPIKFFTTGALPTGITAGTHGAYVGTVYYVKVIDANTFNIAATPGGANIVTSGTQSGVHTGVCAPYGDGDGSTTFNKPDSRGRGSFGRDDQGGQGAANRITSAGSGVLGNVPGAVGGAETVTLSVANLPAHNHGISDPGHAHSISDPTHTHSLSANNAVTGTGSVSAGAPGKSPVSVGAINTAATITIAAAATGVSVVSNTTGITTTNTGSGTAATNLPPAIIKDKIIKIQ